MPRIMPKKQAKKKRRGAAKVLVEQDSESSSSAAAAPVEEREEEDDELELPAADATVSDPKARGRDDAEGSGAEDDDDVQVR